MTSLETEKKFSEKVWNYALFGTIGVIALVALIDLAGPQISALEKSLHLVN